MHVPGRKKDAFITRSNRKGVTDDELKIFMTELLSAGMCILIFILIPVPVEDVFVLLCNILPK